jgi:Spy/CpxP family protein refolding chaperone
MRRFFGMTLPVLAVCMLAGNVAFAQGQGRGRGRGGMAGMMRMFTSVPALIGREEVQKELKVSEEQAAKLKTIAEEARPAGGGGGGGGFQNLSDEERQKFFADMQKRTEETTAKVTAVLTPEQNTRLKQIRLWALGTSALSDDDTAKGLMLTDDQKEALKTINEEADKKSQEIGAGFRGADEENRGKLMAQMAEIRKETEAECLAVLTDEQKAQFTKMKGEKFDLPMGPGRGGPGGGRRGRPGANNN